MITGVWKFFDRGFSCYLFIPSDSAVSWLLTLPSGDLQDLVLVSVL